MLSCVSCCRRNLRGIYFSTLQKFGLNGQGELRETEHPLLSDRATSWSSSTRHTVPTMALAIPPLMVTHSTCVMRCRMPPCWRLPVPLREWDRDTRKVFGDDVDVYDMNRAVEDGAVVPVYFEPRLIPLKRIAGITDDEIDDTAEEVLTGLDEVERDRIQRSVAALEIIYGSDDRLDALAEDFVRHWEDRRENMREFIGAPGKAMIVTATRSIAARLYSKIVALRPEWHSDADDKGKIKVIYSAAPSDPDELKVHMRRPSGAQGREEPHQDVDDELEIAIVQSICIPASMHRPCTRSTLTVHSRARC